MNGTLLSFLFFLFVFSIYWSFIYIKEKISLKRLTYQEAISRFHEKLSTLPSKIVSEYFTLKYLLKEIPLIEKVTLYNKELYYINKKTVVKIYLKNNKIIYKFKNKHLLKV